MCVWNVWRGESTATAPCAGFGCFSRPEPLMRGICDVTSHYNMMTDGMVRQLVVVWRSLGVKEVTADFRYLTLMAIE